MDIIYILIIVALYFNIVATYHVLAVDTLENDQRKYQLLVVWLLPVIGAIIIATFHLTDKEYIRVQKQNKKLGSSIINLLVLIAFFRASASGGIAGIYDDIGTDFSSSDSGSDGGGGGD